MPIQRHDGLKKRCDCSRRQWSKCTHGWHFLFHHNGRHHRYSLDVVARARSEQPPTTKADAAVWRDRLRVEIQSGTFQDPSVPVPVPVDPNAGLTLGDVANEYLRRHVRLEGRREAGRKLMELYVAALRRAEVLGANQTTIRLEQKPISNITTADVRAVRDNWKRRTGAGKGGRVGADRALKRLRHLFNWAIEHGFADNTPFQRHGVVVVHFAKDSGRTRRLEPGEERKLLQHATPWLRTLITAALETGMRKGELLRLRWRDVKLDSDVLLLPADITKTSEARDVPVTQPLRALLELHKHAPDGTEHGPAAFVFGNEVGEFVGNIREVWSKTCQAAGITGLNFHDLRREFASRLRETPGVSDHHVRDWLGHADMATTSKYLATTRTGLQQARRQFERHRQSFAHDLHKQPPEASSEAPVATPEISVSC